MGNSQAKTPNWKISKLHGSQEDHEKPPTHLEYGAIPNELEGAMADTIRADWIPHGHVRMASLPMLLTDTNAVSRWRFYRLMLDQPLLDGGDQ